MKNAFNLVLILSLIVLVIGGCGDSNRDLTKKKEQQKKEQRKKENDLKEKKDQEIIEKLIEKHKAVAPLLKNDQFQAVFNEMYTLDFQSVFLNKKKQPILFKGKVSDVYKTKEKYIVNALWGETFFRLCFSSECSPLLHFELICKKEHISYILEDRKKRNFAFVAKIDSVRKVKLGLEPDSEEEFLENVIIKSTALNDYLVSGECIDLERIS